MALALATLKATTWLGVMVRRMPSVRVLMDGTLLNGTEDCTTPASIDQLLYLAVGLSTEGLIDGVWAAGSVDGGGSGPVDPRRADEGVRDGPGVAGDEGPLGSA